MGTAGLMQADEAGTHARVFKLTGDGALVEFPSVVEAVLAAADNQRAVAEPETGVAEAERIAFRIGINLAT